MIMCVWVGKGIADATRTYFIVERKNLAIT